MRIKSSKIALKVSQPNQFRGGEISSMKKKLSSLLVFALVLTMLAPAFAFAATPADVKGTAYAGAVTELSALGVLGGYPDGTFKPDNTITRAEFAKVVAYAAGFASAAEFLGGQSTNFNDVKASHWASGYIAVATSKGFLKGYPDGTFKPENKVTYAEAVTVLLRVLGYNDSLTGTWPSDYIIQANTLGLISSEVAAEFKANDAAKRGGVAVLANNSLSKDLVVYDKDSDRFLDNTNATTLFAAAFANASWKQNVVVAAPKLTSEGKLVLVSDTLPTDNLEIAGGQDLSFHLGHVVDVLVVNGKAKVLKHDASTSSVKGTLNQNLTVTGNVYVKVGTENKTYPIAAGAKFFSNGAEVTAGAVAATGADVTVFLDGNNARFVIANQWDVAGKLLSSVTAGTSYRLAKITLADTTSFDVANDAKVTLDGKTVAVTDLKANNVVYAQYVGGVAKVVDAYSSAVTGKLSSYSTLNGGTYTVNGTSYVLATGVTFTPNLTVGLEYNFFLNKDGKIVGATAVTVASNSVKGIYVSEAVYYGTTVGTYTYEYTFFNIADGTAVKYFNKAASALTLTPGTLYTVTLTSDNKIDATSSAINPNLADISVNNVDGNKVTVDGPFTYLTTDKTVVVDVYAFTNAGTKKASDLKLASVANLKTGQNVTYKLNANGLNVDYIFVNSANVTAVAATDVNGVFVSQYSVATSATTTNHYAVVNVKGTEQTVEIEALTSGYVKGEFISLKDADSNGKYAAAVDTRVDAQTLTINTTDATGSFVIGGTKYLTDANTAIYVVVVDSLPADIDAVANVNSINVGQWADIADLNGATAGTTEKISVVGGDQIGGYTIAKTVVVYKAKN
jgi:hypothetical protein